MTGLVSLAKAGEGYKAKIIIQTCFRRFGKANMIKTNFDNSTNMQTCIKACSKVNWKVM